MDLEVDTVFLTNSFHPIAEVKEMTTNTDVVVKLKSGEKYIASFFTFEHLETIRKENLNTGKYLNSKYFWTKNMLLIDECSKESVKIVVEDLLDRGDFGEVFQKL